MSLIVKIGATDISEYVIGSSDVPIIYRNRDRTPILGEIDMAVSGKIPTALIAKGNQIKIAFAASSFYPFYKGKIFERRYDYQNRAWNLKIISSLSVMKDRLITELSGILASGATPQQYRASDNEGLPSVQILWIIEKIFNQLGINVSLPPGTTYIQTISFGGVDRVMNLEHLRVDENMFYCINQSVACNRTNIIADPAKILLTPTFWDFFQWFCNKIGTIPTNNMGFDISWSQTGVPEQLIVSVRNNLSFPITDDLTFNKETYDVENDIEGYSFDAEFAARSAYAQITGSSLASHKYSTGLGKNLIDWPASFIIMYEKYWEAAGNTFGLGLWPVNNYSNLAFVYNDAQAKIGSFNGTRDITTQQVPVRVKEVSMDIDGLTVEIVQEL